MSKTKNNVESEKLISRSDRMTAEIQQSAARIRVISDKKNNLKTPQWIKDLSETHNS